MISIEENERLSRVGQGTPMGELLRRYWHPVAATAELEKHKVLPIRILGEDLALYRTGKGEFGLVQQRCPHRSVSLAYGIVEENGLRCAYHGWCFNASGECIEQPFEEIVGNGSFKQRVRIAAYPAQELNGLIFAYLGPDPAPVLPRWEPFVGDKIRRIDIGHLPCNWLQSMENALDPIHVEWLHIAQTDWGNRKAGLPGRGAWPRHVQIDFEMFERGIVKRRLLEGEDPETEPFWQGIKDPAAYPSPMLFPTMSSSGGVHFRVPIDDTHYLDIAYNARGRRPDQDPQETIPVYYANTPHWDEYGRLIQFEGERRNQDFSAWVQQGPITPRNLENLGATDVGILLYRNWLLDNIKKVERGEDPHGVIRDPAVNEPFIPLPTTSRDDVVGWFVPAPTPAMR